MVRRATAPFGVPLLDGELKIAATLLPLKRAMT